MSRNCGTCHEVGHTRRTCAKRHGSSQKDDAIAVVSTEIRETGIGVAGFEFVIGDLVSVRYPWIDYDIEGRVDSISTDTGNVWLYDTVRQYYRGYNFITGPKRGIFLKKIASIGAGKKRRKKKRLDIDDSVDLSDDIEEVVRSISANDDLIRKMGRS